MMPFKWTYGRQGGGYEKLLIMQSKWPRPFDVYLLKFPEGSEVKTHKDPSPNKKHFRFNIVLRKPKKGGIFACDYTFLNTGRVQFFRADAFDHSMSKIEEGEAWMLSIGWLTDL